MNILIDIGHPAHVHYYRNLAFKLETKGHHVLWVVRDIPAVHQLLKSYSIPYHTLKPKSDSIVWKALHQINYVWKLRQFCKKEHVNLAIGTSVSIAYLSKVSRVKSILFDDDDDEVQPLVTRFVHPFVNTLLSPDVLRGKRNRKTTIYYSGYHELAYLHPDIFTHGSDVLKEIGLQKDDTFFIMRFNVFKAHHDIGIQGLSLEQKLILINTLQPHGKVFITTEREIEPELAPYQLKIAPNKIHSLMANATMFLGDSQTMTSEAAVLGIPSLRCNSFVGRIAYIEEEEHRYQLTYGFLPEQFPALLTKLNELLSMPNLKKEFQNRRNKMLLDKIDVTSFWLWFIENYPASVQTMHENPNFQYHFK